MLKRLRDEERGVAMIMALAVAFVVLLLTTVVVAQSIHSLDSSGYDRERLLSINAAEAGTNHWYAYLQVTPAANMDRPGCDAGTGQPRSPTSSSRDRRRRPSTRRGRSMRPTAPRR